MLKSDDLHFTEARSLKKEEEMTWKKLRKAWRSPASLPDPLDLEEGKPSWLDSRASNALGRNEDMMGEEMFPKEVMAEPTLESVNMIVA